MNSDEFTKWLIVSIVLLQLTCVLIVVLSWVHIGPKSIPFSCILAFIITVLGLQYVSKIRVYNNQGKPVDKLNDAVGDVIAASVWTGIGSIMAIALGLSLVYGEAKGHNKLVGLSTPFLAVGVFYGAFVFVDKICLK